MPKVACCTTIRAWSSSGRCRVTVISDKDRVFRPLAEVEPEVKRRMTV